EREQRDPQLGALLGQPVLEAGRPLAVADALEDARGDEPVEAIREDVARDAEAREQLVETTAAECDVADDQQRPAVADELERPGDRAVLAFVRALQHASTVAHLRGASYVG